MGVISGLIRSVREDRLFSTNKRDVGYFVKRLNSEQREALQKAKPDDFGQIQSWAGMDSENVFDTHIRKLKTKMDATFNKKRAYQMKPI